MKICNLVPITLAATFAVLSSNVLAEEGAKETRAERNARIVEAQRAKREAAKEAQGERPEHLRETRDVKKIVAEPNPFDASVLLASGGKWTFVPKGAVLYTPPALKTKIVTKPQGELVAFPQFLASNHAWLRKQEVTIEQAAGRTPFTETEKKEFLSSNKIIISTFRGAPSSTNAKLTEKKSTALNR